jgi:hypothetical protein
MPRELIDRRAFDQQEWQLVLIMGIKLDGCGYHACPPPRPDALSISERTVAHHIQHANDKIGLSTRGAVMLYALQHDLVD